MITITAAKYKLFDKFIEAHCENPNGLCKDCKLRIGGKCTNEARPKGSYITRGKG